MSIKKYFLHSLRGQLITTTLIIIAILFLLIGILQYAFMRDFLYENRADAIHSQIMGWPPNPAFLKQNGELTRHRDDSARTPNGPIMFQPGMEVSYINSDGSITIISDDQDELSPIITSEDYAQILEASKSRQLKKYYIYADSEGADKMVVFHRNNANRENGILQVSIELRSLHKQLYTQLTIYIVAAFVALLTGLLMLLPSLRKTLNPLTNVIDVVERTNAGNLSEKLPVNQKQYEIDQLSLAYNNMLERIDHAFELERQSNDRMRQFIADASHELRTPITSIFGFIEVLQRGAMNNKTHLVSSLKTMEQESKRMTMLVENLLQLAKLDITNEASIHSVDKFSLTQLLDSMKMQLEMMANDRKLTITTIPNSNFYLEGNKNQIKQVILNLVQNAIQHTDARSGEITIALTELDNQVKLTITDNGIGISKEHLPQLFQRFFRVDQARSRASGGAGLGLSISKSIIDGHKGTIDVISEIGIGTSFIILLPKLEANE
ncbi:sensor histidine kinase [Paenibacillus endoradicis]|uniref:sensor histidine kinase n=1 Tax=Paenibacillus endoradicis TaxID=2972487 RepID=UPI0021590A07|nr:HAMP domain-containing sensor histidine kinase [Paenibacillus endoradicis]MCR8655804.1 HAMP domain-containing histidine kinase [Paenibacillus endoradicis]MCR8658130.1 HAMP domain-containing histidine kinase [Paenibacillus endoradicis]